MPEELKLTPEELANLDRITAEIADGPEPTEPPAIDHFDVLAH